MTLVSGIVRWRYMAAGADSVASAAQLGWITPALLVLTGLPILAGTLAFGRGVYGATRVYRAAMIADARQAPARYSGPMPVHIKRLPRLRVLGMEFAGGLFGWPGLGWLYAGQAMPGIGLMLLGPALAWALLPMLFSPYTESFLSPYGWAVLLIWLPLSALASTCALGFYLNRTQPAGQIKAAFSSISTTSAVALASPAAVPLPAVQPEPANSPAPAVERVPQRRTFLHRVPRATLAGVAFVLIALFSVPLIPLVMGIPDAVAEQPLMAELPDRANGAYLEMADGQQHGLLKLFAWSFPVDEFPDSAPAVNPAQVQSIFVSQKGLDDASQYQLYRVEDDDHSDPIPLRAEVVSFQKELRLTPEQPLAAGAYLLTMPTGGMFAGREFYYFSVDPAVTALPPIVARPAVATGAAAPEPSAPGDPWLVVLPLISALLGAALALVMLRRLRQRVRPHEAAWSVAFVLFALAAGSQVAGDLRGWTPFLARLYYVSGATLVVGWLGLGTLLLLTRRPWLRPPVSGQCFYSPDTPSVLSRWLRSIPGSFPAPAGTPCKSRPR